MTRLRIAREVSEAFPNLDIATIVVTGFAGQAEWPEVAGRLSMIEAKAAAGEGPDGTDSEATEEHPHIAAWHAAYRAFGTNPRRERSSADALRRRLVRSGRLPRINPAVDCYNLISVSYCVPAGAFDLAQVVATSTFVSRMAPRISRRSASRRTRRNHTRAKWSMWTRRVC